MIKACLVACVTLSVWVGSALAQVNDDRVWIQVEAQPSLSAATARARELAQAFPDVNGFALGGGWYGVALGPYSRADADALLRDYLRNRLLPSDSYIAFTRSFRSQFYPVGTDLLTAQAVPQPAPEPQPEPAATPAQPETPVVTEAPSPEPAVAIPDETLREARASERRLTRDEKKLLQIAMKWAGFYSAAIDGSYGRGTRAAMAAFQDANNFEPTGVLTTAQRAELLRQYNAVLEGMDLAKVRDPRAGIEMTMPTGVVGFEKYDFPFAHYAPKGDLQARVLLISQRGDRDTLHGLYDIMETLEMVPLDGAREKKRASFVLSGANDQIVSYTEARLLNGEVKGFTLIWPAGDEERRTRVLDNMRASFKILPRATLTRSDIADDGQAVDLVAGLQLRRPKFSRSGFWTDNTGTVMTSADAVGSCTRITIDGDYEAEVSARDDALGIAVLRPKTTLAPATSVAFRADVPRLKSEIAAAGFSYEGRLGAPTVTYGKLEDIRGLEGEEALRRLSLTSLPGDIGGPVFDGGGAVLGMLLPAPTDANRQLPADVRFAAGSDALRDLLTQAGADPGFTVNEQSMDPEDLTALARDVVVLVSCWD